MRQLGTLSDGAQAQRLADYLFTLGIATQVNPEPNGWEIWVRDEDTMERARAEWQAFQANPDDSRYETARRNAADLRRQAELKELQFRRNFHDHHSVWGRPGPRRIPFTLLLMAASIIVSLLCGTLLSGPGLVNPVLDRLTFTNWQYFDQFKHPIADDFLDELERPLGIHGERKITFRVSTIDGLKRGEVWRLVTPIFIHFGLIHLGFNMYVLYGFGGLVERRRGWMWLALFVLVCAVVSNVAQYAFPHVFDLMGPPNGGTGVFGGMSGVLYGLFGYLWIKGRLAPEPGLHPPPDLIVMLVIWLYGLFGYLWIKGRLAPEPCFICRQT
ncbi:MAG TPA: rhomboid family intramembrane serine protease [Gemmatales bacterium]|nr:rhomboid family intramembrane serine protease [Gemmatales bacterium]